ncbi:MAG: hypothetical protein H5U37_03965 [Caldisericia bacterium]|nr:hypothetical protein [Caldisericia bacterium]
MKKFIFLFILFFIFLSFSYQETIVSFGNTKIEVLPNEENLISVKIENAKNLYGYSIHIEFEPENLKIIEIQEGEFLKKDEALTLFLSKVDIERREIIVGGARRGNIQGFSGSGNLFYIKFTLKEKKSTNLKFKEIVLKDNKLSDLTFKSIDINIIPKLQDIPQLKVEPTTLIFKNLDEVLELKISNIGKGTLKGRIYTNDDWIVLNKDSFENATLIYVAIKKESNVEGTIFIESNGGNAQIKVRFEKVTSVRIVLQIGNQVAYVNDSAYLLPFPPFIEKGRTMVPLRFISEHRGAQVLWIKDESKVIIIYNEIFIEMWVDQNKNYVRMNGVFYTIDVAPYTLKGRTVVPVRFISEFLGGTVTWNEEKKTVTITF